MRLKISDVAKKDMRDIKEYLDTKLAIDAYYNLKATIDKKLDLIESLPNSGTVVKFKGLENIRWVLAGSYYIFYTVSSDVVEVRTIIHTARNYKRLLSKI